MAIKYNRILYCTDFSGGADYAFLTALDMAERYQSRLYVLHVFHSAYQFLPDGGVASGRKVETKIVSLEIIEKGKEKLRELYEPKVGALKNNYEFHVVWGIPFVEIVRFARAQDVNCIILGAAGISNIRRITFGSTAENVARRAHCSVMVTRDPEKAF